MPAYSWSSATSGDWATTTNWTPNGIPGAAGGDTATINATGSNNYTVTYDEGAESLNSLTINSAVATFVFNPNDFLESFGPMLLQAGTIDVQSNKSELKIDGGLTTSLGTTINIATGGTLLYNAATIGGLVDMTGTSAFGGTGNTIALSSKSTIEATSGTGTVSFAAITGPGTLEANGGTLLVASTLANANVEAVISNSASSVFETTGALFFGSSVPIDFLGPVGEFQYNDSASDTSVHFNITGLNAGSSTTTPTNFVGLAKEVVSITNGGTVFFGTTGSIVLSNSDTLALSGITGDLTKGWVAEAVSDGLGGTEIFLASVCYAGGTRILTAAGEMVVESLKHGDTVMTVVGDQLVARPVKWLGHRRINLTGHSRPETVAPIRVLRDAFADGMPHRDLLVSPDHAIFADGKLICARQLMNGTTIRQELDWAAVDYYHVELDQHAILLAEGLPAESYIDTGNRGFFANSDAPLVLHPDLTDETDYLTREAGSCAPFVWDEASVRPVWQRLFDRAATIGLPVSQRTTTTEADLRLLADRRTVKPVSGDSDRVIFVLPRGASEVRLLSRAQSPPEARPWLEDRRRLGVRVKRIVLRGADETREVPVDHPDLTRGWWAVERDGQVMSRWTDGEAVLPLPAMRGNVMLEIHLAGTMTYVLDAAPEGQAERRAA
jgi:collagen type I/II/III/V/XI/XXIV/XXVII alpha